MSMNYILTADVVQEMLHGVGEQVADDSEVPQT
jgi:hypothetical protein